MAKLRVSAGGSTAAYNLGDYTSIGSDLFCDVFIPDPHVAQRHAEVHRLSDGRFQLVHLRKGSSTYVNGEGVTKVTLSDGDEIAIGAAALVFEDAGSREAPEVEIELREANHEVTARRDATAEPEFFQPHRDADLDAFQRDFRMLLTSYQLSRALGFERDLDRFLERLLDAAFNLFRADRGAVLLVGADGVTPALAKGRARHGPTGALRLSQGLLREALEQREVLIATDTFSDAAFDSEEGVLVASVRSMMCAPLLHEQRPLGALHLDAVLESGSFTPADADLHAVFARAAARTLGGVLALAELERDVEVLREATETADLSIRELHERNEELAKLSIRDALTGLFNHPYLLERLEEETRRGRRYQLPLSLLIVDIDRLQEVNEYFGHAVGDKVIKFISDVLTAQSRSADIGFHLEEREIATRYSGDKFIVLLPETAKRGAAVKAERLRAYIKGVDFAALGLPKVTVSIGVASFPEDGQDRAAAIGAAEAALGAAKQAGSDQVATFSPSLRREGEQVPDAAEDIARLVGLDRVIHNRALRYVYQPIVSRQVEIFGYEALCRPTDRAFKNPLELIATAEGSGRVRELGQIMRAVATQALPQLAPALTLFINLHPMELTRELLSWGERFGDAARVVLEVTETAEISDHANTRALLQALKKQGFLIALDDLGAGYAGLNSLALLGADFAKLDMAMVRGIHSDGRAARLIRHLLDFAEGEGMRVIAEGIETPGEYQVVCDLGCHLLQGYLFAKPQPPFCEVEYHPGTA